VTELSLSSFPAPHLAVDVAVMSIVEGSLSVLLVQRTGDKSGEWALPGRFVRERERLSETVAVALDTKCGLDSELLAGRSPRQLHLFDDPARDDRGWVMSAAHLVALPYSLLSEFLTTRDDLRCVPVAEILADTAPALSLPYGQCEIVSFAVTEMRRLYSQFPDPEGLLVDAAFTLAELHAVHVGVLGVGWQIDTFRRRMLPQLEDLNEMTIGRPGRPASLYAKPVLTDRI
jgi:8-oxo-dGTP diphosphatase